MCIFIALVIVIKADIAKIFRAAENVHAGDEAENIDPYDGDHSKKVKIKEITNLRVFSRPFK